jgi:hypothetical protein
VTSGVDLIISYTNTLVGNSSLHDIRNGSLASSDSNTIFFAIAVPNINFKYGPIDIDITSNNRINKAPTITAGNNAYATATVNVESIGASNTFTFASTSTSTTVIGNKGSISISNDTAQSSISNEANTLTNNSQTLLGDFVKLNPLFIGSLGDINTIENKAISTLQHIAGSGGQDASIASQLESFLIPQHYYG